MQATEVWSEIFKSVKGKSHKPQILYSTKITLFKCHRNKCFLNQTLRDLIVNAFTLLDMLKDILHREGKLYVCKIYIKIRYKI